MRKPGATADNQPPCFERNSESRMSLQRQRGATKFFHRTVAAKSRRMTLHDLGHSGNETICGTTNQLLYMCDIARKVQ